MARNLYDRAFSRAAYDNSNTLYDMCFINGVGEVYVRGKLPNGIRITLSALTVIDVHARDVSVDLAEIGVHQTNDFQWLSQLRY